MSSLDLQARWSRRRMLGTGVAGGAMFAVSSARAAVPLGGADMLPADGTSGPDLILAAAGSPSPPYLPGREIAEILQGPATASNRVLQVSLDRDDLGTVKGPLDVPFKAPFQLTHDIYFQSIGRNRAIVNAEATLLTEETNPFIDQLLEHGLVFQGFHQHYIGMSPQVWHIHFRGVGEPLALARAVAAAIKVTATPLPQKAPSRKTPLDAERLGRILGGEAEVEDEVVVVTVPRKDRIRLGKVIISPELGVAHTIEFLPLDGAKRVAVGPDFSLTAREVNPVHKRMRSQGFFIGCLYNQETAEIPQLYFSHQLAVGDPYDLASKVRRGLELTNADFS